MGLSPIATLPSLQRNNGAVQSCPQRDWEQVAWHTEGEGPMGFTQHCIATPALKAFREKEFKFKTGQEQEF